MPAEALNTLPASSGLYDTFFASTSRSRVVSFAPPAICASTLDSTTFDEVAPLAPASAACTVSTAPFHCARCSAFTWIAPASSAPEASPPPRVAAVVAVMRVSAVAPAPARMPPEPDSACDRLSALPVANTSSRLPAEPVTPLATLACVIEVDSASASLEPAARKPSTTPDTSARCRVSLTDATFVVPPISSSVPDARAERTVEVPVAVLSVAVTPSSRPPPEAWASEWAVTWPSARYCDADTVSPAASTRCACTAASTVEVEVASATDTPAYAMMEPPKPSAFALTLGEVAALTAAAPPPSNRLSSPMRARTIPVSLAMAPLPAPASTPPAPAREKASTAPVRVACSVKAPDPQFIEVTAFSRASRSAMSAVT